jgi:hypothetical protein
MKEKLEQRIGGTGYPPVPSGQWPDGILATDEPKRYLRFSASYRTPAARQVAAQNGQVARSTQKSF